MRPRHSYEEVHRFVAFVGSSSDGHDLSEIHQSLRISNVITLEMDGCD